MWGKKKPKDELKKKRKEPFIYCDFQTTKKLASGATITRICTQRKGHGGNHDQP